MFSLSDLVRPRGSLCSRSMLMTSAADVTRRHAAGPPSAASEGHAGHRPAEREKSFPIAGGAPPESARVGEAGDFSSRFLLGISEAVQGRGTSRLFRIRKRSDVVNFGFLIAVREIVLLVATGCASLRCRFEFSVFQFLRWNFASCFLLL